MLIELLILSYNKVYKDIVRNCWRNFQSKLEQEYSNLSLWYFVSFITGVVFYFKISVEPSIIVLFLLLLAVIVFYYLHRYSIILLFCNGLVIFFIIGIITAQYKTINTRTPILSETVIADIKGTVEKIKPSIRGYYLTINITDISTKYALASPIVEKVKISVPHKYIANLKRGDQISCRAKLFPPRSSVVPGGYDFSFYDYFHGIGASGYTMSSVNILQHSATSKISNIIDQLRQTIYVRLVDNIGSDAGNFAAAILLGETKAINPTIMQNMRESGISHILCVSGLHLSLVAMLLFTSSRFILNLVDYIAFNYNIKLIAAIVSLIGSYFYLELSGMQIAATRAFIMTAIIIIAIMFERHSFPVRSIGISAIVILSFNPAYVFHPSFQLSFIAVLSLIAGYEFYLKNRWRFEGSNKGLISSLKFYILSNIYSSFLASIVTAPLVINQFYIFSTYSIIANLIAVPIMSFILMPLAIMALIVMPFGFEHWLLKLLAFFINIITEVAAFINNIPGSIWYFGHISSISLGMFLFSFFWLCLWQNTWRLLGGLGIVSSFLLMLHTPKAEAIFDPRYSVLGIQNAQGKIEIYGEKMPYFNRKYWANWFGQKDVDLHPLDKKYFTTKSGYIIALNQSNALCHNQADIIINLADSSSCIKQKSKESLVININTGNSNVFAIYCSNAGCYIENHDNNFWRRLKHYNNSQNKVD